MKNEWYITKDGLKVFNTKADDDHIYQLTNEYPKSGEYCLVSLEHDPIHVIKVKSFDPTKTYPLNNEYCYGANLHSRDGFYGIAKIIWTSNSNLQRQCEIDAKKQDEFWKNSTNNTYLL